jgi:hypothetical protein
MNKLLALSLTLLVSMPALAEDQYSLGAGVEYSSGKYGNTEATDIVYVPVTGKYVAGRLALTLTVPWISVTGPGGVVRGMGRLGMSGSGMMSGGGGMMGGGTGSTGTTRSTSAGLGDVIASAGYDIYSTDATRFDLVGNVKFGTANANRSLGTGQNDYSAQVDAFRSFDETVVSMTLGYRINGSPAGISLNNTPYGAIGASRKLQDDTTMGMRFDMAKSPLPSASNLKQASVYVAQQVSPATEISFKAMKGFSDGDPDYGLGLYVSHTY